MSGVRLSQLRPETWRECGQNLCGLLPSGSRGAKEGGQEELQQPPPEQRQQLGVDCFNEAVFT